jgi:hypothetical protein
MGRLWLIVGLVLALMLAFESTGLAQCAMCRASLAGSNNAFFIRNFNIGVLVLLTPPVAMFCTIFVVLKRYGAAPDTMDDSNRKESEESEV